MKARARWDDAACVWRLRLLISAIVWSVLMRSPSAMEMSVFGDQLVMSGEVINGDLVRIERVLAGSPAVNTVILRNSSGGDAPTGYQVGALFRQKRLRTVVSGYCYSSCSRMFLGGEVRVFSDDFAAEETQVGFHGHYGANGMLQSESVARLGLRDWIVRYSDGKADVPLVERWISIPRSAGMIHFFHPGRVRIHDVSTFMCQGPNPFGKTVFDCEPISETPLDLGIVTSLEIVHGNDASAARLAIPPALTSSGFAAIDDVAKAPLATTRGREEYLRFLGATGPRAFAVAPDREHWAWIAGNPDPALAALLRCAGRAGQTCALYAVGDTVIWNGP